MRKAQVSLCSFLFSTSISSVRVIIYFLSQYFIFFLTIYSLCSFIFGFPSFSHILIFYGLNFFYASLYFSFLLYLFLHFSYFYLLSISCFSFLSVSFFSSLTCRSLFYRPGIRLSLLFFHFLFLHCLLPFFVPFSHLCIPTELQLQSSCPSVFTSFADLCITIDENEFYEKS